MPLDLDNIFGVLYLSPADFTTRARSFGVDVAGVGEEELKAVLAMASRAVEAHVGRAFIPDSLTETHRWNAQTRRVAVNQPPVMTLEAFSIRFSPTASLAVRVTDVLVNNQEGYLEVASMAMAAGLVGVIETAGISEALAEVKYKSFQSVPGAVAAATGITAARFLHEAESNDMLPAGLKRSKVGSEDLSRSDEEVDIPLRAKALLRQFQRIALA